MALGTVEAATQVSDVFIKTNLAAAFGVVVAMAACQVIYGRVILPFVLNGAIGGLVAITAEPLTPSLPLTAVIGGVGGLIVVLGVPLLDRFKIDDVVGAIPAHLFCGIWGTLVVPLSNSDANFGVQLLGVVAIGAFVSVFSFAVWAALKFTMGIRSQLAHERDGLDLGEMGLSAYPEWSADSDQGVVSFTSESTSGTGGSVSCGPRTGSRRTKKAGKTVATRRATRMKREMKRLHDVDFDALFALTNMPIEVSMTTRGSVASSVGARNASAFSAGTGGLIR